MQQQPPPEMWDARYARGPRVLCIADGEGRNSVFLAGHGLEVSSIDLSESGVATARRLAAEGGVGHTGEGAVVQVLARNPSPTGGVA